MPIRGRTPTRRICCTQTDSVAGPWARDQVVVGEPGSLGLLMLQGILGARRQVERRAHLEILGPGELVRPWVELGPEASVPYEVAWTALEPTRVAVLDRRFVT